jgi:hypothetical protein
MSRGSETRFTHKEPPRSLPLSLLPNMQPQSGQPWSPPDQVAQPELPNRLELLFSPALLAFVGSCLHEAKTKRRKERTKKGL